MIDPGKLRWRATFQSRAVSRDDEGSAVNAYTDLCTVWVEKVDLTGSEARRAGAIRAEATLVLKLRDRSDITEQHRLYFEGRYHDIVLVNRNKFEGEMFVQAKFTEGAAA